MMIKTARTWRVVSYCPERIDAQGSIESLVDGASAVCDCASAGDMSTKRTGKAAWVMAMMLPSRQWAKNLVLIGFGYGVVLCWCTEVGYVDFFALTI